MHGRLEGLDPKGADRNAHAANDAVLLKGGGGCYLYRRQFAILPLSMDVNHTNLLEVLKHLETRNADPEKHEARMPPEHAEEPMQKEPRG